MESNLYMKLLSIQEHIDSFYKNKKTFNYSYVDGNSVLSVIRPLMNANKLLLKQEIISIENSRQDYKTKKGEEKSEILSKVMLRFTWVDCESGEKDVNDFGANGMNDWDKGVGSALTYGERYFLLKYFHIPTDSDDPDEIQRKKESDSKNNVPENKEPNITWLSDQTYNKVISSEKIELLEATISKYSKDGFGISEDKLKNLKSRLEHLKK